MKSSSSNALALALGVAFTAALGGGLTYSSSAAAQSISKQCFAYGDMAAQIASWRNHGKTKPAAIAQLSKYYSNADDRDALTAVIEQVYAAPGKKLVPDRVEMMYTTACLNRQH